MTDTQLYLCIGIPSITIVLAWLSNKADMNALRAELRSELRSELGAIRSEMIGLRKEIYEALIPLHERMAVIEAKQK